LQNVAKWDFGRVAVGLRTTDLAWYLSHNSTRLIQRMHSSSWLAKLFHYLFKQEDGLHQQSETDEDGVWRFQYGTIAFVRKDVQGASFKRFPERHQNHHLTLHLETKFGSLTRSCVSFYVWESPPSTFVRNNVLQPKLVHGHLRRSRRGVFLLTNVIVDCEGPYTSSIPETILAGRRALLEQAHCVEQMVEAALERYGLKTIRRFSFPRFFQVQKLTLREAQQNFLIHNRIPHSCGITFHPLCETIMMKSKIIYVFETYGIWSKQFTDPILAHYVSFVTNCTRWNQNVQLISGRTLSLFPYVKISRERYLDAAYSNHGSGLEPFIPMYGESRIRTANCNHLALEIASDYKVMNKQGKMTHRLLRCDLELLFPCEDLHVRFLEKQLMTEMHLLQTRAASLWLEDHVWMFACTNPEKLRNLISIAYDSTLENQLVLFSPLDLDNYDALKRLYFEVNQWHVPAHLL
jgi:hypothetical protein